jgi:hypothetical protein
MRHLLSPAKESFRARDLEMISRYRGTERNASLSHTISLSRALSLSHTWTGSQVRTAGENTNRRDLGAVDGHRGHREERVGRGAGTGHERESAKAWVVYRRIYILFIGIHTR